MRCIVATGKARLAPKRGIAAAVATRKTEDA